MKELVIDNIELLPGEEKIIELNVAQLPTRTEINIPVTVYRSEQEGPTLLLMAGMHGDEINGIEIVRRILDSNYHHVKAGSCICIPIVNVYGFLMFSREVPDGKDINRSFPGSSSGSLAWKVANEIMEKIVSVIDYGIDFHTGGDQRSNYPQIRGVFENEETNMLTDYFQPPFKVHSRYIERTFRWAASEEEKEILLFEGGESMRFNQFAIQEGIDGTLRVMKQLGMRDEAPQQPLKTIEITDRHWIRCKDAGLWKHKVFEGDFVEKGQILGYTSSPYGEFRSEHVAGEDGYIIGLNYMPVVNRGDALVHIGHTSSS